MAAGESPTSPKPTVTIGELYLAQGHRREAIAIFQRVLSAEPANRRAREALERLGVLPPRATIRAREVPDRAEQ
ncbi:MAG: tetratricopeptide repeat protein [Holophagales bacterium]|nr:tetratricopeptide repeat protein [Holophagales bacterium]MYF97221.1 tetratricopeptide repeat protein [Holophagales bacterium]